MQPNTNRFIYWILPAFFILGATYSIINPLHEATDELRHYRFVRYIVEHHALPIQGEEPCRSQSHHPPLFYALGALVTAGIQPTHELCYVPAQNPFWAYRYWDVGVDNKNQYLHGADEAFPWQGDDLIAHMVRLLNVLIGTSVVWLTWAIGHTIWPKRPTLAIGATAFIAFNPMFLYMSAAINNDVIAAFSGALILYGCVRLWRDPQGLSRRWGIWLGIAYGIALLSKFNLAAAGLLIAVSVTWTAWQKQQWRLWLEVGLLSVGTSLLLSGWWFVRNQRLYGDLAGFEMVTKLWGVRDPRESLGLVVQELPYAWTTLWGRFGFGQIPLPAWVYSLLGWVVGIALLLAVIGWIRDWRHSKELPAFVPLLFLNALLFFGVLFNYMLVSPAGPMGRFFFPGLPALVLLISYGLHQLMPENLSRKFPHLLSILIQTIMLAFALISLFGYIAPAYARPPVYTDNDIPQTTFAQFDSFIQLQGYDIKQTIIQPGQPIDLDLYWTVTRQPPGDYLFFVHLIDDETQTMIAQRDTYPGLGKFPASQWREGDRFVDSIRLYLPETAYTPSTATLSIGLYAPDSYRLAIFDNAGNFIGDSFPLTQINIESQSSNYPNPQTHSFENTTTLVGYDLNTRLLDPNDPLTLHLFWTQAKANTSIIQIHLLNQEGHFITGLETPLLSNLTGPTTETTHTLTIPADLPAGIYQLDLALLDSVTGKRDNIVGEDGHWIDNHILLPQIRVK